MMQRGKIKHTLVIIGIGVLIVASIIAIISIMHVAKSANHDIYPQVWSENAAGSESYEFKVNCGSNYKTLDTCFLWNLTNVTVRNPKGIQFQLNKDFNINNYSGEITRRWVLYGAQNGGLPPPGVYTFDYYKNNTLVFTQALNYTPQIIGSPTNVTYKIIGDNLSVSWTAPKGMAPGMWYKVVIFPQGSQLPISKVIIWNATSALLPAIPLQDGTNVSLNVAAYFNDGYSYSNPIEFVFERT